MPLDKQSLQNTNNTAKMVKQEDSYNQRVPQNMTVDKTQVKYHQLITWLFKKCFN